MSRLEESKDKLNHVTHTPNDSGAMNTVVPGGEASFWDYNQSQVRLPSPKADELPLGKRNWDSQKQPMGA